MVILSRIPQATWSNPFTHIAQSGHWQNRRATRPSKVARTCPGGPKEVANKPMAKGTSYQSVEFSELAKVQPHAEKQAPHMGTSNLAGPSREKEKNWIRPSQQGYLCGTQMRRKRALIPVGLIYGSPSRGSTLGVFLRGGERRGMPFLGSHPLGSRKGGRGSFVGEILWRAIRG